MKDKFYLYFLRRPDRDDPFEPGRGCPFYVGKGSNGRKGDHRKAAKRLLDKGGTKSRKINIIHKLWKRDLDFEEDIILEDLTENEANEYEIEAISAYGRLDLKTGCLANMTNGGEGTSGAVMSDEAKKKLSDARVGRFGGENNPMYGKTRPDLAKRNKLGLNRGIPFTEEHKKKIGEKNKGKNNGMYGKVPINAFKEGQVSSFLGKKHTIGARAKMREAKKGYVPWIKGKEHSEETKRKISEAAKRRWQLKGEDLCDCQ